MEWGRLSVVRPIRFVAGSLCALVVAVAGSSPALAVPPEHQPSQPSGPGSLPAGIACAFPVSLDLVSGDQGQNITFFDHNGNVVRIVGTARPSVWQFTNLDTNVSYTITLPAGTEVVTPSANGTTTIAVDGGAIGFNAPTDSPPGPFSFVNIGRLVAVVDANGHTTSLTLSGKRTDLCAKVAP